MINKINQEKLKEFIDSKRNKHGKIILTESAWRKIPSELKGWTKGNNAQVLIDGKFEIIEFDRSSQQEVKEMNYESDWFRK